MAQQTYPVGTVVTVASPAKADPRSEDFAVYFDGEVTGTVIEVADEFSAIVEGPYPNAEGETLIQYVAWEYLTPVKD